MSTKRKPQKTGHATQRGKKKRIDGVQELPIVQQRSEIITAVKENQVSIIVGETGSGKTTQIPQFLYQSRLHGKGLIAITQPRRVAAVTVARRVASEMQVELGQQVGYSIRFDDRTTPRTRIKYLTDGLLLREAMADPLLRQYSVIVLDEVHERSLHTDILLGLLKIALYSGERSDLKVIVMSATLQAEKFVSFFRDPPASANTRTVGGGRPGPTKSTLATSSSISPISVAVLFAQGRQYPVDVFYTFEACADYLDAAVVSTLQLHVDEQPVKGDILLFLTGQEEIETMATLLTESVMSLPPETPLLTVHRLYASMPPEQQLRAFAPAAPGTRKVICSTNIAETSVTIPGVRYVIDPGLVKVRTLSSRTATEMLQLEPVSKQQAWQRAGRAGRLGPGKCYRLFTEATFDGLDATSAPEVQRCSLAAVTLQLKALGVADILAFPFLEPPPAGALRHALQRLLALGALSNRGVLTEGGEQMARLPVEPVLANFLLKSAEERFDCALDAASVVAMLSVAAETSVFYTPRDKGKAEAAKRAREVLSAREGDHLTLLNIYTRYAEVAEKRRKKKKKTTDFGGGEDDDSDEATDGDGENSSIGKKKRKSPRDEWCHAHFLNARAMRKATQVREQLLQHMRQMGFGLGSEGPGDPEGDGCNSSSRSSDSNNNSSNSNSNSNSSTSMHKHKHKHPHHQKRSDKQQQQKRRPMRSRFPDAEPLKRALVASHCLQLASRSAADDHGQFAVLATKQKVSIHPSSVLFSRSRNDLSCVVFNDIIFTSKQYICLATAVDPTWLPELLPRFFGAVS